MIALSLDRNISNIKHLKMMEVIDAVKTKDGGYTIFAIKDGLPSEYRYENKRLYHSTMGVRQQKAKFDEMLDNIEILDIQYQKPGNLQKIKDICSEYGVKISSEKEKPITKHVKIEGNVTDVEGIVYTRTLESMNRLRMEEAERESALSIIDLE